MECPMENEGTCKTGQDLIEIKESLNKVVDALLGNEFNEGKGWIYRIVKLESEVKILKAKAIYMSGASAGAGLIIGYVIKILIAK